MTDTTVADSARALRAAPWLPHLEGRVEHGFLGSRHEFFLEAGLYTASLAGEEHLGLGRWRAAGVVCVSRQTPRQCRACPDIACPRAGPLTD